jgi:integrase
MEFLLITVRKICEVSTVSDPTAGFSMPKSHLKLITPTSVNRTVVPPLRKTNKQ